MLSSEHTHRLPEVVLCRNLARESWSYRRYIYTDTTITCTHTVYHSYLHTVHVVTCISRVAAGFSQFSKNIPKPFHHVVTCIRKTEPVMASDPHHKLPTNLTMAKIFIPEPEPFCNTSIYVHVHVLSIVCYTYCT